MWFSARRGHRTRDELAFHRDQLIEDYVASGMDRQAAERRALLEFGSVAVIAEQSRDVRGRWLEDFARDLGYALRTLRRSPGFAAVAILSLALAIGANSAIFGLANAVLLRPLPVPEPDRLVRISRLTPEGPPSSVSYPLFEEWRDNIRSISSVFVHGTVDASIVIDGDEELVAVDIVSGAYFEVLGVRSSAGRLLGPADDVLAPAAPAAVISDRYWQRRFGRSASAIGTTLTTNGRAFTIVGVMPASFQSVQVGRAPDVVLPLLLMMSDRQRHGPTYNFLQLLARLAPGATVAQVDAEARALWPGFIVRAAESSPVHARQRFLEGSEVRERRVAAWPAPDGINNFRDQLSQPLVLLMGFAAGLLVLAAANLSGLFVARAAARQREVAIRLAIGAGRGRLVRQFLTESLVLAVAAGGLGVVVAAWLSRGLASVFANGRALDLSVAPDARVMVFTAVVSLAACLLAGLVPALQATRVALSPALREVRARGTCRLGRTLVVAQVAISMVLVVGATLFVGTFVTLNAVDRGFDGDRMLVVDVRSTSVHPSERVAALVSGVVDRLKAFPGVESAGAAQVLPVTGIAGEYIWVPYIRLPPEAARPGDADAAFNVVTPGYFDTLRTAIVAGRDFDAGDTASAQPVAIVNASFARYFFGDASPIGRVVTSTGNIPFEIVGVVRDTVYHNLRGGVLRTMYIPWAQREGNQPGSYRYLVRVAAGHPMRLAPSIDRLIREVDPTLRVRAATPYATLIDRSMPSERILALLGGLFGALALVIAGIGLFALLAFQVARRTNELGVRRALGASAASMVGLVVRDVVWMLVPGVAIGAGLALAVTGLARGLLFGLTPTDPRAFAIAAAVLAGAALLAAWLPARRASRVNPLVALRSE
jgi:predicted permease